MATRLQSSSPEFQVNFNDSGGNGIDGNQTVPDATALGDGRFVIAYQSDFFGSAADEESVYRLLDSSLTYLDLFNSTGFQGEPAVAPRADGGFGVVFTNAKHADNSADTHPNNVTYIRVSSAGVFGPAVAVGDFDGGIGFDSLSNPEIATLSTGRQVVVFERANSATDHDVYLNVVDAAGTATQFSASALFTIEANLFWQGNAVVAADLNNRALVVFEDATLTTLASMDIRAQLFDGATNLSVGGTFTIADHAEALATPSVATIADNRYVIVYSNANDVWGRIYDPSTPGGAFLSDEFQIDTPGGFAINPSVAATIDGGFIVTWADWNGSDYDVRAHRFDAHGLSYGDSFIASAFTDASQLKPTIATSGANVVIAWEDLGARVTDAQPSGIRARQFSTTVFDYDSAGIGDLNADGRVDILFQNDTGNVAVWQTNGAGALSAITSLGPRPAGYMIDGTGNFNSTPGDDILLRSSGGTIAIWPTSGISVGAPIILGGTPPAYHIAGVGNFTGDNQDDILFRSDTGQIVSWGIIDNSLAIPPRILGSTAPVYHIVGIDDFTGDHQSDILFRNDDGTIAVWRVANNELLSATVVGATSTAYHVVSTGDFDGNGAKDILFRGDSGELVEWLLDSTGALLMAPTSIGTVGANYHVDGTGDLNGDGRDDIIFRDAGGTLVEWLMNGTSLAAPPAVIGFAAVDYAIAAHHFDVV